MLNAFPRVFENSEIHFRRAFTLDTPSTNIRWGVNKTIKNPFKQFILDGEANPERSSSSEEDSDSLAAAAENARDRSTGWGFDLKSNSLGPPFERLA